MFTRIPNQNKSLLNGRMISNAENKNDEQPRIITESYGQGVKLLDIIGVVAALER